MNMAKFGALISTLRKERDIPQSALADTLGVTRQAVSKWERGEGFPDITILLSIAKLFDVSVDSLLKAGEVSSAGAAIFSQVAGSPATAETADNAAIDDIIAIAPHMKVSTLAAIADKLAEQQIDISNIVQLSEFMSDNSLAKMLSTSDLDNLNDELLAKLIPFLGTDSLYTIFNRIIKGENSSKLIDIMKPYIANDYNFGSLVEAAKMQGALEERS